MTARIMRRISSAEAARIDEALMSEQHGFGLEQLMELAGLSCAQAIAQAYPPSPFKAPLVCCGPGNNGGDGLVLSRHLVHFGYSPSIFYPKQSNKQPMTGLVQQNKMLGVPFVDQLTEEVLAHHHLVVDAIFGFSFKGDIRPPFDAAIKTLRQCRLPVVSIDIPSGWDVEEGDTKNEGVQPEMLISLTAPKLCARFFKGKHHFLGGRFVPKALEEEFQLNLPPYTGTEQCVDITHLQSQ